jgi:hypothetical protein
MLQRFTLFQQLHCAANVDRLLHNGTVRHGERRYSPYERANAEFDVAAYDALHESDPALIVEVPNECRTLELHVCGSPDTDSCAESTPSVERINGAFQTRWRNALVSHCSVAGIIPNGNRNNELVCKRWSTRWRMESMQFWY